MKNMATSPRKMKDPTEAALSAIQDALNLRDGQTEERAAAATVNPPTPMTPMAPEANDAWPQVGRPAASGTQEVLFEEEFAQRAGDPAQRRGAANDDRRSVGQLLQSLQQRPSRGPYVIAAICALVWTGLGIIIAMNYYGGDMRAVGAQGGPGAAQ